MKNVTRYRAQIKYPGGETSGEASSKRVAIERAAANLADGVKIGHVFGPFTLSVERIAVEVETKKERLDRMRRELDARTHA